MSTRTERRLDRLEEKAGVGQESVKRCLWLSQLAAGSAYYLREDDGSRVHVSQFRELQERHTLIVAICPEGEKKT